MEEWGKWRWRHNRQLLQHNVGWHRQVEGIFLEAMNSVKIVYSDSPRSSISTWFVSILPPPPILSGNRHQQEGISCRWLTSSSRCTSRAVLLTEPHERQEGDLAFSDRYISISVSPGAKYICFSDSFLFSSLSPLNIKVWGLEERKELLCFCGSRPSETEKRPSSLCLEAWQHAMLLCLNHSQ